MAGSKKYKDKLCAYCRLRQSTTADHVFSREFFQVNERNLLPKVPSCEQCNNEKSKLEHYLTTILPFGATHSNAGQALTIDVKKRLNNNQKLFNELRTSMKDKYLKTSPDGYEKRLTFELDYKYLNKLVSFIGRGLLLHHFDKYLPIDCSDRVFTPSPLGMEYVSNMFNLSTMHRVDVVLGNKTIRYKGVMSEKDEGVSIWAIQLLGGITVSDEDSKHVFNNSFVAMFTGSNDFLDGLKLIRVK